jgi:hypothetical protein
MATRRPGRWREHAPLSPDMRRVSPTASAAISAAASRSGTASAMSAAMRCAGGRCSTRRRRGALSGEASTRPRPCRELPAQGLRAVGGARVGRAWRPQLHQQAPGLTDPQRRRVGPAEREAQAPAGAARRRAAGVELRVGAACAGSVATRQSSRRAPPRPPQPRGLVARQVQQAPAQAEREARQHAPARSTSGSERQQARGREQSSEPGAAGAPQQR